MTINMICEFQQLIKCTFKLFFVGFFLRRNYFLWLVIHISKVHVLKFYNISDIIHSNTYLLSSKVLLITFITTLFINSL